MRKPLRVALQVRSIQPFDILFFWSKFYDQYSSDITSASRTDSKIVQHFFIFNFSHFLEKLA